MHYQMIDVSLIDADPASPRKSMDEAALKSLAHSIQRLGVIHPLLVQPLSSDGRHTLIVGERRWRAAVLAGETQVPAMIRACETAEVLEVQVTENRGLGVRAALEPRDMANAIQTIVQRFDSRDAAAEHLGGTRAWLNQATAAANLSPKVSALLNSGKIASAGTAIQLEKLVQKSEARAQSLIEQVQQPDAEKLTRKVVDRALHEVAGRRSKREETRPEPSDHVVDTIEHALTRGWINPGKVKRVADLLGLPEDDEEQLWVRLVDEFLALKDEAT